MELSKLFGVLLLHLGRTSPRSQLARLQIGCISRWFAVVLAPMPKQYVPQTRLCKLQTWIDGKWSVAENYSLGSTDVK